MNQATAVPILHPVRVAFAGMFLVIVSLAIGRFAYTPILPYMAEALHLSKTEAGLIGSANFLGYLAGSLITSRPRLPGGRRPWMLLSTVICGALTAAMGLTSSVPLLIAIRFAGGTATAISFILSCAMVIDYLAQTGRFTLARIHFAGVGFGIILSAGAVDYMARIGFGWSGLWYANGVVCLVATVLGWWLLPPTVDTPPALVSGPRQRIDQRLLRLIIAYGLFGFGYVITATFLSVLVRSDPNLRWLESYIWMIVGLASIPSLPLWDWAGQRIGYLRAYSIASLVEMVGVALSVTVSSSTAIVISAILVGGTMTGLGSLAMIGARELIPAGNTPRIFGIMTVWFSIGQIVGPLFAGVVAESTGSFRLPSLLAALVLVVCAALVWTRRPAPVASGDPS